MKENQAISLGAGRLPLARDSITDLAAARDYELFRMIISHIALVELRLVTCPVVASKPRPIFRMQIEALKTEGLSEWWRLPSAAQLRTANY